MYHITPLSIVIPELQRKINLANLKKKRLENFFFLAKREKFRYKSHFIT